MAIPKVILLFSGKRKSGKDYITEILQKKIGPDLCSILRLSAPLKNQYAIEHNLDFSRLLDATEYKEKYRSDMIVWGEEKRNLDPGYFCRVIASGPGSELPVWIISDARRKTDIQYFKSSYEASSVLNIRVVADDSVRTKRGWVHTAGVDDVASECDLDSGVTFDLVIENNGDGVKMESDLDSLVEVVRQKLA